ncbi:hypothetical protein DTO006G1_4744 [Penicillium roqueforti]|uniref:uncharacterized protein n=1 Tax=Penicillium roqueforti TaxID=5082 RepID=UPI00190BD24C|nr:uncharacterized protein LCP9604111_9281 [Penicillium roqueforti]KAF9239049.1 hypothetical protein LCP9604111_9281 [Penicillium roqueforti]KAI1830047.1 hypothetical protein CBS147337_9099 [Penicillium roqueforti]KAI2670406.1 hypothetical protein CBS147355_9317 [Penicillium roqueforti]KAI2695906.1 hypothetical protein CBS147372_8783 [Penicillium roqueforti]KAI2708882.1 hypothetical protein CBS147318_9396 [Penicillium roqueforti]
MADKQVKVVYGGALLGASSDFSTPAQVEEVLRVLEENGVKDIDTAQIYRGSEELLGQTGAASRFIVDTKHAGGFVPGTSSKELVIERANESLRKLNTNSVNIFYLHAPDRKVPLEETLAAINELYQAHKFHYFGLSNFRADEVEEVIRICKEKGYVLPSVYQGNYNAISRLIETELFPVLRRHNIRFYAYSPIAGGFLTKSKEALLNGGQGRWDSSTPIGQLYNRLYNTPSLLEALDLWDQLSKDSGVSKAELAYRWVAFHSQIQSALGDAVVVGASSVSQLKNTLAILRKGPLEEGVVRRIDGIWETIKDDAVLDNFNASS